MRSAVAVHELASCVPDPHTVQAPQLAAPAVAANVVPALHAAQVLEAVPVMAPWPAWHWQVRSDSGSHAATCSVPLPQTVHGPHGPAPILSLYRDCEHCVQLLYHAPLELSHGITPPP